MAGNLTDYLENALLAHSVGQAPFTSPTTYAALFTVAPTDSTAGTEVNASGNNYARTAITWGAPSAGSIANSANIRFPTAGNAGGTGWGTVVAIGIMDQSSAGNVLWYGSFAAAIPIGTNDSFTITSGGLILSLD